jgi:hypothetical protein
MQVPMNSRPNPNFLAILAALAISDARHQLFWVSEA